MASEEMNSQDEHNGEEVGREADAGEFGGHEETRQGEDDSGTGEAQRAEGLHGDENVPDGGAGAEGVGEDPLVELAAERDRLRDQHLRLAADFDNYRKRTEDRLRQGWDRAQADLVSRLLDPLDDLLRVTALEPENKSSVDSIVEGVDLVERKFFRVLGDAGVEVVDPAGEAFDPNTMEAMMRVPTEAEEDDDTVAMVFQRGYTLRGVLIRPARVSVFKSD
ncbi:MAG: nucleotide exchange factor GrpE [Gemmatimonadetes bacterium]|nr:nucleotide exchange factor GrpE [Gemmatimonadota bacterium]MYG20895.1 nucleotide exchange factor GrpE [Gemmatimonadota bacterium]MYJ38285.1 nucleotide exchange factor GrpE [Gemmatimonadota bacterium]